METCVLDITWEAYLVNIKTFTFKNLHTHIPVFLHPVPTMKFAQACSG